MSRLIVKGLPKHYTDANVRDLFSFAGELTDAKVVRTRDGRSRQFGFVGFRNRQAASTARKALDATYVGTARVSVQVAHAVGDDQLPRPWSRYSEGSSRYMDKHDDEATGLRGSREVQKRGRSRKQGAEIDNAEPKEDARLDEFVEVARGRKAVPVWADGSVSKKEEKTMVPSRKTGGEGKLLERKHVTFQDSDEEDDELYDDLPERKEESSSDEGEEGEGVGNLTALNQEVSDMDYFKSKVVASPNASTDIDPLDDNAANESDPETKRKTATLEPKKPAETESEDGSDVTEQDADTPDVDVDNEFSENPGNSKQENQKEGKPQTDRDKEPRPQYLSDGVDAAETGRLLLRNLAFSVTEEEVEGAFEKFGMLSDVHIVRDGKGGRSRGIGFVQYMIPEMAAKAMVKLDGTVLSGRILHVLPAKPRPAMGTANAGLRNVVTPGSSSFKTKKEAEQKEAAHLGRDSTAQHALHLSSDAVADIAAQRHGVSKAELLGTEKGESGIAAVRLAMAEASLQQETRQYLLSQGVDLAKAVRVSKELGASTAAAKRKRLSRVAFLVKNLPAGTTRNALEKVFCRLGKIQRLIVVPSGLLAVVQYATASDAKRAYNGLAYTKFQDAPLYLEWLPSAAITEVQQIPENDEPNETREADSSPSASALNPPKIDTDDAHQQSGTVYVKNLNFDTRDKDLKEHFSKALRKRRKTASALRSATVAMKRGKEGKASEKLSMGFGFLEFASADDAKDAVKLAQNTTLHGHVLELKMSNRKEEPRSKQAMKRKRPPPKGKPSAKLIVRNVAFEATRKDIRRLFGVFGQLKVVRLPRKMDGSHRGFAFVEFVSKGEAQAAMEALTASHLYGRHLVMEFAEEHEDQLRSIAELQEKTASYMAKKRIRRNDGSALELLDDQTAEGEEAENDEELQDALYG